MKPIDLYSTIVSLDSWVTSRQWQGNDPYLKIERYNHKKIMKSIVSITPNAEFFLKLIGVSFPPVLNIKAIGIFLQAYCSLYRSTRDSEYLDKAIQCAEIIRLNNNAHTHINEYYGWGYPFDWDSRIFFPKGIPFSTVGIQVGNGLYELYNITHNKEYLDCCDEICQSFLTSYNRDTNLGYESAVCYSYSPIDNYHVHNSNLAIGELFAKTGELLNNREYLSEAKLCANYALSEMGADGSLFYWAKDQATGTQQDVYHCGFEIRHLCGIGISCRYPEAIDAAYKRYHFMVQHFSGKNGMTYRNSDDKRLVDIHGCAERILTESLMLHMGHIKSIDTLSAVLRWTISNMRKRDGSYKYRRYHLCGVSVYDNTPYMRWGQAWMLLALSHAYEVGVDEI